MSVERAEQVLTHWRTMGWDADLWYEAMAVLLGERAPA
jgi:hypothetical protein